MLVDCDAVLFCFDVNSQDSFYALSELFQMKMQLEYNLIEESGTVDADEDDDDDESEELKELSAAMSTLSMS